MLLWLIVGAAVYLCVAVLVARFVTSRKVQEIRRELLEEALPSALTGDLGTKSPSPQLAWVETVSLTAEDGWNRPDAKPVDRADQESAEIGRKG